MNVIIPKEAEIVIRLLNEAGFEAYLVGGAVRDACLGKQPKDTDVCTNAMPDEMEEVFCHLRTIPTGIRHGTLTVLTKYGAAEVTTYRVDGVYSDHRRPDQVSFTRSLTEDLARRDITVNAMAYHPDTGLVDPFGGREDLQNKVIRAVGDPRARFTEDALRILRVIRFASVLDAKVEKGTHEAVLFMREDLHFVAAERIREELFKLLAGDGVFRVLETYAPVLTTVIPEIAPCIDCPQETPHHCFDVYRHILHAVESAPKDPKIRMALLLHDIEKPSVKHIENGVAHFYGHDKKSAETAYSILSRLRVDKKTIDTIVSWVKWHDSFHQPTLPSFRRRVAAIGAQNMEGMLAVLEADLTAQSEYRRDEKKQELQKCRFFWDRVQQEDLVLSVSELAIGGDALVAMGCRGKQIGEILHRLLDEVIDEKLENQQEALLLRAKTYLMQK